MKKLVCIIINYFQGIFSKQKDEKIKEVQYSKEQKELFELLKTGDLVWAKMPLSEEKLSKVPEGHKIRPYLVMYKSYDFIYGLYCSSKKISECTHQIYGLNKNIYHLSKHSWVYLHKIHKIPIKNLNKKICSLRIFDKRMIDHRLQMNKYKLLLKYDFKLLNEKNYYEGDVILYDSNLYYIWNKDTYYHVLKVYDKHFKNAKMIKINRSCYFTKFHKETFKKAVVINATLFNVASYLEKEKIKKNLKEKQLVIKKQERKNVKKIKHKKDSKNIFDKNKISIEIKKKFLLDFDQTRLHIKSFIIDNTQVNMQHIQWLSFFEEEVNFLFNEIVESILLTEKLINICVYDCKKYFEQ